MYFSVHRWILKSKGKSEKEEEESKEKIKDHFNKSIEYIENESKGINYDLFKHYFNFVVPSVLAKQLYETKMKIKITS